MSLQHRNRAGIERYVKSAFGVLLLTFFTHGFADSSSVDDRGENPKLKDYDRLAIKVSDNPSGQFEVDGHKLGAGFIISRELDYSRHINSRFAARDFVVYSGLTWYSLLGLAGSCTALGIIMSRYMGTEFPGGAPNFKTQETVCGIIVATIPVSLLLRIYFRKKAINRYNADLKSYLGIE